MDDYTSRGALRRWMILDGFARCPYDAVDPSTLPADVVAGILASNEAVRAAIAAVEALEAAHRIRDAGEPPATIYVDVTDEEGETVNAAVHNPAHVAWEEAGAVIAAATEETLALYAIRHPEPVEEGEAEREPDVVPPDPLALDLAKAAKAKAVDVLWEAKHTAGYPHDFGGAFGVKVLQTRESDQPFWLALAQVSSIMVAQSMGDVSNGSIRTLDNANIPVTASEALAAMLGMQAYLGTILAYSWALKDQVANAADMEALDAIDITAGWPA